MNSSDRRVGGISVADTVQRHRGGASQGGKQRVFDETWEFDRPVRRSREMSRATGLAIRRVILWLTSGPTTMGWLCIAIYRQGIFALGSQTRSTIWHFERGNWISFRCCGDSEWSVRPRKACPPAVYSPGVGPSNARAATSSPRRYGRTGEAPARCLSTACNHQSWFGPMPAK